MAKFEVDGFDDLQKELKRMQRNVEELAETKEISFGKLFNKKFMAKHTRFRDIDELFKAGGFKVESEDDFDKISEEKLDNHIAATTEFSSWEEMMYEAYEEYASKKLNE